MGRSKSWFGKAKCARYDLFEGCVVYIYFTSLRATLVPL